MIGSLILRPTFLVLIFILNVVCMDDALDEADEIYRSVNEGFPSQDQEFLMDLFSKDDHYHGANTKDSVAVAKNQLIAVDADIDKLGKEN